MSDPGLVYLFAAFAIVWLAIGGYVVRLTLAQRDVDRRLERLEAGRSASSEER